MAFYLCITRQSGITSEHVGRASHHSEEPLPDASHFRPIVAKVSSQQGPGIGANYTIVDEHHVYMQADPQNVPPAFVAWCVHPKGVMSMFRAQELLNEMVPLAAGPPRKLVTAEDMPHSALLSSSGEASLPLRALSVTARVVELCAEVTVVQEYENTLEESVEAVFVFPVHESAAVCSFKATTTGGRVLSGKCVEKTKALDVYDDSIAAGHSASLMEKISDELLKVSLGNLMAKESVTISFTYVEEAVMSSERVLRFFLPASLSPKNEGGLLSFPTRLSLEIAAPAKIKGVITPKHKCRVEVQGAKASVTLIDPVLKADFVALVSLESKPSAAAAWAEYNEAWNSTCLLSCFFPSMDKPPARELIFLVDRSGSMEGDKMTEVIDALQLFLRSIPLGTRFNIVCFGSSSESMFPEPVPYTIETLEKATQTVSMFKADMGGTSLLQPLNNILDQPVAQSYTRYTFVLTDGDVEDRDSVLQMVKNRQHRLQSFVSALGIGTNCSTELVRGISTAGNGLCKLSKEGRVEPLVMALLGASLKINIESPEIHWSNLPANPEGQISGAKIGEFIHLYQVIGGADWSNQPGVVTFDGQVEKYELSLSANLLDSPPLIGSMLHCLAAKRVVTQLERMRATAQATEIALKYGLLTRRTAYVCVEQRRDAVVSGSIIRAKVSPPQTVSEKERLRTMADEILNFERERHIDKAKEAYNTAASVADNNLPRTHPVRLDLYLNMSVFYNEVVGDLAHSVKLAKKAFDDAISELDSLPEDSYKDSTVTMQYLRDNLVRWTQDVDENDEESPSTPKSDQVSLGRELLQALVLAQKIGGNWELEDVWRVLKEARPSTPDECPNASLWATCLALALLEEKLYEFKAEWTLLYSKAMDWASTAASTLDLDVLVLLELAKAALNP